MFRNFAIAVIFAGALSAGSVQAGALDALSRGGAGEAHFQGLWSPAAGAEEYQAEDNVRCVFRVRWYKQGWKYKRYAAFPTFREAKQFLLKKKMEGFTSNLTIHEISPPPAKKNYWLP
mgnify:FL=1